MKSSCNFTSNNCLAICTPEKLATTKFIPDNSWHKFSIAPSTVHRTWNTCMYLCVLVYSCLHVSETRVSQSESRYVITRVKRCGEMCALRKHIGLISLISGCRHCPYATERCLLINIIELCAHKYNMSTDFIIN